MQQLLIGTRKRSFIAEANDDTWHPRIAGNAGVGVNFLARNPYDDNLWALLGHGHWGAKLSRSKDGGQTWQDAA